MHIPEAMRRLVEGLERPADYDEAVRLFCTPPRTRMLRREEDLAALARTERVDWAGLEIATWRWGDTPEVVLLHGWGGRGLQLGAMVEPLLKRGFGVLALDLPAHGDSGGDQCTALMVADLLLHLAERGGVPRAIVAHSFGSIGACIAHHRGLPVQAMVFYAGVATIPTRFQEFAFALGYSEEEVEAFMECAEERFGRGRLDALSPFRLVQSFRVPGLLIHDRSDDEVLWSQAELMSQHWPGVELHPVERLGHYRIIRDRSLAEFAADFIQAKVSVEN